MTVGLAAGFFEPLESTGTFLMEDALNRLAARFPARSAVGSPAARFNRSSTGRAAGIRDFLEAHYVISQRDEPFWVAARNAPKSPWLEERLSGWRTHLPTADDLRDADTFVPIESWIHVLAGTGWLPDRPA